VRTKNVTCSMSCGAYCVWIDTDTLANFNLEMHA
jgi:hypothetical protein